MSSEHGSGYRIRSRYSKWPSSLKLRPSSQPNVTAVGLLNFKQIDAAVAAGRIAARTALEANPHLVRRAARDEVGSGWASL